MYLYYTVKTTGKQAEKTKAHREWAF